MEIGILTLNFLKHASAEPIEVSVQIKHMDELLNLVFKQFFERKKILVKKNRKESRRKNRKKKRTQVKNRKKEGHGK